MHRAIPADETQDPIYQVLPFVVGQRAQGANISEMLRLIGITARTAERTLACNLY
jgi:hypothetical protein